MSDGQAPLGWLGGALSGLSDLIGTGGSLIQGNRALDIEQANYDHMREQYEYSKELQQTIFNREDTAMARKVADMKAAGLSPYAFAATGARAGSTVPVQAPQRGTEAQKIKKDALSNLGLKDIAMTIAEIGAIQAQTRKTNEEANYLKKTQDTRIGITEQQLSKAVQENSILSQTLEHQIQKIKKDANTSHYKEIVAKAEANMSTQEATMFQTYYNYVRSYVKDGKISNKDMFMSNPYALKYLAIQLQNTISQHNIKVAGDNSPIGSNQKLESLLANAINRLMPSIKGD